MIIFEFSDFMVEAGKVPAPVCVMKGPNIQNRTSRHGYMQLAERAYRLDGSYATVMKDRNGSLKDFELSGEDAVALALKAVVI
jgi:hypothetical protein